MNSRSLKRRSHSIFIVLHKIERYSIRIDTIQTFKRYHSSSKIKERAKVKLTNFTATRLIKNLYSKQRDAQLSEFENQQIIENAMDIYNDIDEERNGFLMNTFLKLCLFCKQHQKALMIWNDIESLLKRNDITMSYPLLLSVYGRCSLQKAEYIFYQNPDKNRDLVSIGLIMKYYIQYDEAHKALELYDNIDLQKDDGSHISAIKACIKCNNVSKGKRIHSDIKEYIDKEDKVQIKTSLIELYNHFNERKIAIDIFESINDGKMDIVCISTMMKCLIDGAKYKEALDLYDNKISDHYNVKGDDICNVLAIKACIHIGDYDKGKAIHQRLKSTITIHSKQIHLKNILIHLYGESGDIETAHTIFESIEPKRRDIAAMNAMMKAYISNNCSGEALKLYDKIYKFNSKKIKTNHISHLMAIKACTANRNYEKGKAIHSRIDEFNIDNIQIKTALMDLYGHSNDIESALDVFNSINHEEKNIICINSMMSAYIENEEYTEALRLYEDHMFNGIQKDTTSHILAIKSCTNIPEFERGKQIHNHLSEIQCNNIQMKTSLIGLYGHCGDINTALHLYDSINDCKKDIFCVDTMMEAYCNNDMNTECIDLYHNMKHINSNLVPDLVSYVTVLKACTNATSLYYGKRIHKELKENVDEKIYRHKNIEIHLINMYGKCGVLDLCEEIMEDIKDEEPFKYVTEIGIWNAMIHAHGRNGNLEKAKECYQFIQNEMELTPNRKTFILLINACSHVGDIEEAKDIWNQHIEDDEIKYDEYVMSALIDGMSRKGFLRDANELIVKYHSNCKVMWMSLLFGCCKYEENQLAQQTFDEIKNRFIDDDNLVTSASILLSNVIGSTVSDNIDGLMYRFDQCNNNSSIQQKRSN